MEFERIKKKINGLLVRLDNWCIVNLDVFVLFTSFLFYLGLWPRSDDRQGFGAFYRKWLPHSVFVTGIYVMIVGLPGIIVQRVNDGKVQPILESFATYFAAALMSVHLYCLMFRKDKFRAVFEEMDVIRDVGKRLPYRPSAILMLNVKWMELLVFASFTSELVGVGNGMILYPRLYVSRKFRFDQWYPFDGFKSPAFEILFVVNNLRVTYHLTTMIMLYSIIWGMFLETVGQYQILAYNLEKLRCNSNKSRAGSSSQLATSSGALAVSCAHIGCEIVNIGDVVDEELPPMHGKDPQKPPKKAEERLNDQETLKLCIQQHQSLIRFVHLLESAFEPILVMHIICTLVPTGLAIALFLNAESMGERDIMNISLIIGCYMLLTAVYLICEEITGQDEGIRDAIYGCDWSGASESFKRSMRIVMSYCNQPLVIQLAGFILMNNENLHATMKLTYSYTMTMITQFK